MQVPSKDLLNLVDHLQSLSYPNLLLQLLEDAGKTRGELYSYIFFKGYLLEKPSMYRYFNPNPKVNRKPDEEFLAHFADFVGLNDSQCNALILMREFKRIA
jgi:hypothetical protein